MKSNHKSINQVIPNPESDPSYNTLRHLITYVLLKAQLLHMRGKQYKLAIIKCHRKFHDIGLYREQLETRGWHTIESVLRPATVLKLSQDEKYPLIIDFH